MSREVTDLDIYIGTRIKEAREEIKRTQAEAGESIGVSSQQFSKYERGEDRITAANLSRLAKFLKKPIKFFLEK